MRIPAASARGQSLIEFALILPFLLAVCFLLVEFGRALWIQNILTLAAGAAARVAIVDGTGGWRTTAWTEANRILSPFNIGGGLDNAHFATATDVDEQGIRTIDVTITEEFSFLTGGFVAVRPLNTSSDIPLGTLRLRGRARLDTQPSFTP